MSFPSDILDAVMCNGRVLSLSSHLTRPARASINQEGLIQANGVGRGGGWLWKCGQGLGSQTGSSPALLGRGRGVLKKRCRNWTMARCIRFLLLRLQTQQSKTPDTYYLTVPMGQEAHQLQSMQLGSPLIWSLVSSSSSLRFLAECSSSQLSN